eukprot:9968523-Alexandrium_andersonii.AAC.1
MPVGSLPPPPPDLVVSLRQRAARVRACAPLCTSPSSSPLPSSSSPHPLTPRKRHGTPRGSGILASDLTPWQGVVGPRGPPQPP